MGVNDSKAFRFSHGPTILVLSWAGLILVGAGLLCTPAAATGESVPFLDALFTSTSAVCVTGLATIDVGRELSPFGQGVLLGLIQIGGLGISTVSTLLLVIAGRATISQYYATQKDLAAVRVRPLRLLLWAVTFTLVAEGIGTVILSSRMGGSFPSWEGVFHSVSAFCNAGFSLYSSNLMDFRTDVTVNATVAGLIATGGIGFIALRQLSVWLWGAIRRHRVPMYLHTRTVLLGSVVLWLSGALIFLLLERNNTMADLSWPHKVLAAAFQSVTPRTAGYNTLDFGAMREPTLIFTVLLMLVGGAPGSCAGGLKITTVVVVIASVRARLRGDEQVSLLRRTVPTEIVSRAFYTLTLGLLLVLVMVTILLLTEEQIVGGRHVDRLTGMLFETTSAFGTVGLSTGVTPLLSPAGKIVIILTMFCGRLGPLAVALAVFRQRPRPRYEYPKEELATG